MLWEPRVSGFMQTQLGLSGLECILDGNHRRWVAQRWLCEPMDLAGILRNLSAPREYEAVKAMHPNIRGTYCWSAQNNIGGGNVWGSTMKSLL